MVCRAPQGRHFALSLLSYLLSTGSNQAVSCADVSVWIVWRLLEANGANDVRTVFSTCWGSQTEAEIALVGLLGFTGIEAYVC